jgi:glycine/D-amino acid oxidase-like deaminating enzyme
MLGVLGEVTAAATDRLDDAELLLRDQGARAWPGFANRVHARTGQPLPIHLGTVVIANLTNAEDQLNLTAIAAAADRLNRSRERIDPSDVSYLHPAPGHQTVDALFLPDEGFIDTSQALPAVHAALENHPNITYVPHTVTAVQHDTRGVTGAELSDGTHVRTRQIVLAAGVATQDLLDELHAQHAHTGVTARLLPGKGTSFTLTDPGHQLAHVIRTPNRDFACGTHLIPRDDGGLYLGATNRIAATPAASEQPSGGELHALIHSAGHEINTRIRTVAYTGVRHGMRPLSSDGRPLIGPTDLLGLYLATGTYRNGVLLAPAIAGIIADHITGQPSSHDTADTATDGEAFAPTAAWRADAADVTAVLKAGVPHLVSFVMEPGGHLPYDRRRELETVMVTLFRLAFTTDPDLRVLREQCIGLLRGARVPETVPQLFYAMAASR